jgi:3D (Asp-Asp-Asp) domain-containing protein
MDFEAAAYVADCSGCSGYTSWHGLRANAKGPIKMMAVDPTILQLGTCYTVKFSDQHESIYLAADTGGNINGYRVDLLMSSYVSAIRFGLQKVSLEPITCPIDVRKLPHA